VDNKGIDGKKKTLNDNRVDEEEKKEDNTLNDLRISDNPSTGNANMMPGVIPGTTYRGTAIQ
jgi:hypothetical protein